MAKSTEIKYFADATAKCQNCNSVYTLGMTVENLSLEICGNCHPFYTGKETLIDTAGRIEKFKERLQKGGSTKAKTKKTKVRKTIQTLADLSTGEDETQAVSTAPTPKAAPKEKLTDEEKAELANEKKATKEKEVVSQSSEVTEPTDAESVE